MRKKTVTFDYTIGEEVYVLDSRYAGSRGVIYSMSAKVVDDGVVEISYLVQLQPNTVPIYVLQDRLRPFFNDIRDANDRIIALERHIEAMEAGNE